MRYIVWAKSPDASIQATGEWIVEANNLKDVVELMVEEIRLWPWPGTTWTIKPIERREMIRNCLNYPIDLCKLSPVYYFE